MSEAVKPSLLKTFTFIALAAFAYLAIFLNIVPLNQYFMSKSIIPVLSLLGTIIGIAFLYGTAVSYVLSLLGLENNH